MRTTTLFVTAMALIAALAVSCSNDDGGGGVDCPAGTENCPCTDDDTCDEGLTCTDGFCVTGATCPEGSLDCPCYANGSCDSRNGVEMVCEDNVCVLPGVDLGGLGDACDADKPCGTHEGTQLLCEEGVCALPTECEAGTFGCPCDEGACEGGLECVNDVCQAAEGSGIFVGNAEVRACDVLFELADADVQFAASVKGVTAMDGDRVAFSFVAIDDSGFAGPVGAVVGKDGAAPDVTGLTPTKVECYDRLGAAVTAPDLEIK